MLSYTQLGFVKKMLENVRFSDQPDTGSTISNRQQDQADRFFNTTKYLSRIAESSSAIFASHVNTATPTYSAWQDVKDIFSRLWSRPRRRGVLLALIPLLFVVIYLGVQWLQLYHSLTEVKSDVVSLEQLNLSFLNQETLNQAGSLLEKSNQDIETLRRQVSPWLWMTPVLGWVPVYGGDLKYAGDLLQIASGLTQAASQTYQIAFPIWQIVDQSQGDVKASELKVILLNAQPSLLQSQTILQLAIHARSLIVAEELSPTVRSWLTRADPYLTSFDEALSLALSLPRVLGANNEGIKTYLILVQNEDELRPTGGYITAVGKVVVQNGELINWNVADSASVDDFNKPYPSAPWQMQKYMNIPILVFRDSNWSPDYPSTVQLANDLYAYTSSDSVNGVIAIDQHVLKTLLSVTGPINVSELNITVSSDNVEEVMRAQKIPPPSDLNATNWNRKQFMNPIAAAILAKILSGHDLSWEALIKALLSELDQRHILVEVDDPTLSKLLNDRGWDGAVSRITGDFLMAVDTNVGYNKTNAVISEALSYDVDLSNLAAPVSNLAVIYHNGAQGSENPCVQGTRSPGDPTSLDSWYPINHCYYNYLRVYVPAGTQLDASTPEAVSRNEMIMLDQDVPAHVDQLTENLQGLQSFGTLLVVPMGENLETDFQFNLPADILGLDSASGDQIYQLKIQKQAGTVSIPIKLRVFLPQGSKINSVAPDGSVKDGNILLFNLQLATDVNIRIQFHP